MTYRTGRTVTCNNIVNLVFDTKCLGSIFDEGMLDRTEQILGETCLQMDCKLLDFSGGLNHVHLVVNVHPKIAVSNLIGKLKGKSSFMIRREYEDRAEVILHNNQFWSPSYCVASSCEGESLDIVKQYIEQQSKPPSERAMKTSKALIKNKD